MVLSEADAQIRQRRKEAEGKGRKTGEKDIPKVGKAPVRIPGTGVPLANLSANQGQRMMDVEPLPSVTTVEFEPRTPVALLPNPFQSLPPLGLFNPPRNV
jgi:hypothetical protein